MSCERAFPCYLKQLQPSWCTIGIILRASSRTLRTPPLGAEVLTLVIAAADMIAADIVFVRRPDNIRITGLGSSTDVIARVPVCLNSVGPVMQLA